jgi:hypothetical protein
MGSSGRVVDELQQMLLAAQTSALAGVTLRELVGRMGEGIDELKEEKEN